MFCCRERKRISKKSRTIYIAQDNRISAEQVIARLHAVCRTLTEQPRMGVMRQELRTGLRMHPVGTYLIFYQVSDTQLEVCTARASGKKYSSWNKMVVVGASPYNPLAMLHNYA